MADYSHWWYRTTLWVFPHFIIVIIIKYLLSSNKKLQEEYKSNWPVTKV